jgi:hypothetical protein
MRNERRETWDRDGLVFALLAEHIQKHGRSRPAVVVAIEVHDIVEIAGSGPLSECPELFTESLHVCLAIRPYSSFWLVAVGMKYFAANGREHQPLIGCEVELDFGPTN